MYENDFIAHWLGHLSGGEEDLKLSLPHPKRMIESSNYRAFG